MTAYRQGTSSDWLHRLPHVEDRGGVTRAKLYNTALALGAVAELALVARSGDVGSALCTAVCFAAPALMCASASWSAVDARSSTAIGLDGLARDRDQLISWTGIINATRGGDGRPQRRSNAGLTPRAMLLGNDCSVEQVERLFAVIEAVAPHVTGRPPGDEPIEPAIDPQCSQPPRVGGLTDLLALRAQRREELAAMSDAERWAFRQERRAKLALPAATPGALVINAFELALCDDPSDRAQIAACATRCVWSKTARALEVITSDAPELTPLYEVLGHRDPRLRRR